MQSTKHVRQDKSIFACCFIVPILALGFGTDTVEGDGALYSALNTFMSDFEYI